VNLAQILVAYTIYCFCFAVKNFCGLRSFLPLFERLLQLPPNLCTLDSNIHGNFHGNKVICENHKNFLPQSKGNQVLQALALPAYITGQCKNTYGKSIELSKSVSS